MGQMIINHDQRTITISGRTFRLVPRDNDTWDVFEADTQFGWFKLKMQDGEWVVTESATNYETGPGATVTAGKLGVMWAEARDPRTPGP